MSHISEQLSAIFPTAKVEPVETIYVLRYYYPMIQKASISLNGKTITVALRESGQFGVALNGNVRAFRDIGYLTEFLRKELAYFE